MIKRRRTRKNPDGFLPDHFVNARIALDMTLREVSDATGIARATISRVENGTCHSPKIRAALAKELGMGIAPGFTPTPTPTPKAAPTVDYKQKFEDLAKWVLNNCIDDLAVSYAKFALVAAERGVRV